MYLLAPALLVMGCAENFEFIDPIDSNVPEAVKRTRSLEAAFYNEVADAWVIPQADPFSLTNFQAAYDKLATGHSSISLTRSQLAEFSATEKLIPTHYAMKIYPRNEEEQWYVETMDDVQVAYIPFDQIRLTTEEIEVIEQSKTRSVASIFREKSPYTVTYYYTDATDGGPIDPTTFRLPILYTVWPILKPMPVDLEYVVDYEVFIPDYAQGIGSQDVLRMIESEAISSALGLTANTRSSSSSSITHIRGYLLCADNTLGINVPMSAIHLKGQLGTYIKDFPMTSFGGYFSSYGYPSDIATQLSLTFRYQDSQRRWKITDENSTEPYETPLPIVVDNPDTQSSGWLDYGNVVVPPDDRRANVIYRAMDYFFDRQIIFPRSYPSGGLRIIAHANNGRPYYLFGGPIHIYNRFTDSGLIGDVLHELGHNIHYENANLAYSTHIEKFVSESFASYVSWYYGERYYQSLDWMPDPFRDISGYSRQYDWTKNTHVNYNGYYSPLFVDMTDSFNQSTHYTGRPNDEITGVPPSERWNIITSHQSWTQCRAKIQSYIGTYYTASNFNNWIADFDKWVADNQ